MRRKQATALIDELRVLADESRRDPAFLFELRPRLSAGTVRILAFDANHTDPQSHSV